MRRQGLKNKIAVFAASILILLMLTPALTPIVYTISSPEELPINKYGWLDEIVFFTVADPAKAVEMLEKGDMDIYFKDIGDVELFRRIRESPALSYDFSYGLYYELTFNPIGPEFPATGKFNPFYNPKIREAMNMLVDRQYIVDELMGGLGIPKFVPVCKGFSDYERHKDVIASIESKYAYNFEKAKQIISSEMLKVPGVELRGGKWYYKGEEVVIKVLIRTEDKRRQIGDYVSTQLEKIGFTVERMYKTSREASPIWIRGNPADGKWHVYTGGWLTTAISRDDSDNFQFFYTPKSSYSWSPLWLAYTPDPNFQELADKLAEKKYNSIEERTSMMKRAFEMGLQDSARVFLVDQTAAWAKRKEVNAVGDLSAGYWWGYQMLVMNRGGKTGGTVKIGSSDVLTGDAWNPIAGSGWIYDAMVSNPTGIGPFILDPKNGLPILIGFVQKVTLDVEKTALTFQNPESSGWLTVNFVDSVTIPSDAWYAWDVEKKKVVTAGEAGVTTAKVKIVAQYEDIIGKLEYHDGTVMSLADWVWSWPINFERASEKSPIYDESYVGTFESWREMFRAWRIVSEHPLTIEWYTNYTSLDAELIASAYVGLAGPWHTTAIGIKAEEKGLLAFGADKAQKNEVEWMNYIAGTSLDILSKMLDEAITEGYIPFRELNSKYITVEEARARYNALKKWYAEHNNFWVGNGPYYLDVADSRAHTAVLKPFRKLLQRELVISVEGSGTTDPEPGSHGYFGRETVTITAKPGFLSVLEKWVVDGVEKGASATLTLITDKPHSVKAVFRLWYEAVIGIVAVIVIIAILAIIFLRKKKK